MKITSFIISIVLCGGLFLNNSNTPTNKPKFIKLEKDYSLVDKSEKAFTFTNPDTALTHDMYLLKNVDNLPLMYYSNIATPVCIDNLCKPVFIEMYWDLLGNYVGYGEFTEERLSKFDHDDFEVADYLKLHELLSDQHSVLGKRPLKKLYDISESREVTIKFKGVEIDGVSGATKKEIKNEIVDGALYSCHKLWRIAYGAAVPKIKENISTIYSDDLANHLLRSNHQEYHMAALKLLSDDQIETEIALVVEVLRGANALTRSYILKKLPKHLFAEPVLASEVFGSFYNYDNNSKTLIVSNLQNASAEDAVNLAHEIPVMSKNQLKIFLCQIKEADHLNSVELKIRLTDQILSEECIYYYMIEDHLKYIER